MRCLAYLFVLVAAIGACAQQSSPEKAEALPYGSAVIADFKGEIALRAADGTSPVAQKGLVLAADAGIETGKGSILLSLADGSQVLIKAHTRVQLQAPNTSQGNFLQLFLGNIMAKVQKRLGMEPSFRMGTPTAVITVRGTRFSVEVTKKNKTIVEVYEGLVEVVGLVAPSRPVMIRPGFSTQVGMDSAPENPHSMQGPGGNDGGEAEKMGPHNQGLGTQSERPESVSPVGSGGRQSSSGENPD